MKEYSYKKGYGAVSFSSNQPEKRLSYTNTFISLLKSMICTGVLYFPKSFYMGGVVFSCCACCIVSLLTYTCMKWLSRAETIYGGSYPDLAGKAMGIVGVYLVEVMIFITQTAPGIVTIGFILANTNKSVDTFGFSINDYFILAGLLVVLIPLCLSKTITEQSWAYLVADVIIIGTIIILGIYSPLSGIGSFHNLTVASPNDILMTLGVLVYGFEGTTLVLPIKSEMSREWEFEKLLAYMMVSITFVFLWFSLTTVYSYGSDLQELVTLNLPNEYWAAVLNIVYVGSVILTFPLSLHPAFLILEKYLQLGLFVDSVIRTGIVLTLVMLGFFAKNALGLCVSIIGGLFCAPLAFIFPAVIHYSLTASTKTEKVAAFSMIMVGTLFGIAAIINAI